MQYVLLLLCVGGAHLVPLEQLYLTNSEKCGYDSCTATSPGMLNVHIVPHTHDDVGWLKTVDQYYYGSRNNIQKAGVQYILDSVVKELWESPKRRFIYVETAFFWKWWVRQPPSVQQKVRVLVSQGRLQMVGGAWSMNDEAASHYQSTIDQFTWGLRKLNDTFGQCGWPHVGWQIDPFGHSREFANLLSMMGYDGLFLGRIDYQDKRTRLLGKNMEMLWRGDDVLGKSSDIFTGVLYNTYSPPPGFCFDVLCSDEPIIDDATSPLYNVETKIPVFLDYVKNQARYYKTQNVIVTMGGDFTYQDASMWYINLDKLIKYSNLKAARDGLNISVFYSTPNCYLKSVKEANPTLPTKKDDFFPYASDPTAYWTGYFTSRPTTKFFEREGNNYLQTMKQLQVLADLDKHNEFVLNELKSAMGVMQHHDAITGTEKQHVTHDYERLLNQAIDDAFIIAKQAFNKMILKDSMRKPMFDFQRCHLNESSCQVSENSDNFVVTVYNPLGWSVKEPIRIPVPAGTFEVFGPYGTIMKTQMVPLAAKVKNIPTRVSKATQEIVFLTELKPLSYRSFYIKKRLRPKRSAKQGSYDYYPSINQNIWSNDPSKTDYEKYLTTESIPDPPVYLEDIPNIYDKDVNFDVLKTNPNDKEHKMLDLEKILDNRKKIYKTTNDHETKDQSHDNDQKNIDFEKILVANRQKIGKNNNNDPVFDPFKTGLSDNDQKMLELEKILVENSKKIDSTNNKEPIYDILKDMPHDNKHIFDFEKITIDDKQKIDTKITNEPTYDILKDGLRDNNKKLLNFEKMTADDSKKIDNSNSFDILKDELQNNYQKVPDYDKNPFDDRKKTDKNNNEPNLDVLKGGPHDNDNQKILELEKILVHNSNKKVDNSKGSNEPRPFNYPSMFSNEELRMLADEPHHAVKDEDEIIIGNQHFKLEVNRATGIIKKIIFPDNSRTNFSINMYYYIGTCGDNHDTAHRASGAYIFRPSSNVPIKLETITTDIIKGDIVQEIRLDLSPAGYLDVKFYDNQNYLEVEWVVGPIPILDDTGKEYIIKYETHIANKGKFYTDSNGRQILERCRDHRPQWNVSLQEPIPGNYYPVANQIYIKNSRDFRMSVLTDRSQGGSSMIDGEIELMLHRRLLCDDAFGVGEALNETAKDKGLVARGKHRVYLGISKDNLKKQVVEMHQPPILLFADATNIKYDDWFAMHNEFSWLERDLPKGIHLLTLEPWDSQLLIRLENYYNDKNASAEVNLQDLFKNIRILAVEEMLLAGHRPVEGYKKWTWKKDGGKEKTDSVKGGKTNNLIVNIKGKEIKTYLADFEIREHSTQVKATSLGMLGRYEVTTVV
ncbi:lysosomal alpha-mannosidase-like isoform X1 [Spodoptera frugiperda]|uniref:alpha-mannosidase n=1 Tax=Spodoptera frugiperda TaxID=7108 RepID=A0A9R0EZZ7_SPOFR|nr:lysosomal alpha-mannosidase-like isoform X1 [Spodoptera frugiperda]